MTPETSLAVVIVLVLVNLAGSVILWQHINRCVVEDRALAQRVSHLEAAFTSLPNERQLSEIREGIAAIRERAAITADALATIQKYLVERERHEAIVRTNP